MRKITFGAFLDFEETLTFEELGLLDNETDKEIINKTIEKYFLDLTDSNILEFEERVSISEKD
jgi:hypothetical protein